jgi:hypothetical protein
MFHLGVHPQCDTIHLETQSFCGGYCLRDNKGVEYLFVLFRKLYLFTGNVPCDNKVDDRTSILKTGINVETVVDKMKETNSTKCLIRTSTDPGRYGCS